MPRKTFADTVETWRRFLRQVDETGIEIPGAGSAKDELDAMYKRAYELVTERDALEAARQAATRELREILDLGSLKLTTLRQSLKVHLGYENEALTAYGIRPSSRRRKRSSKPDSQE